MWIYACFMLDFFVGDHIEGSGVEFVGNEEVDMTSKFHHDQKIELHREFKK